jgi:chorismate-pyruvate lyase
MPDRRRAFVRPRLINPMSEPLSLLYPLDAFYATAEWLLPSASALPGEAVPEPYRRLLVHEEDMTPTLEAFHGERIHLRLLARRHEGDTYSREVVLTLDDSNRPVEFGAIVIHLQRFPPAARELILAGQCPLGTILALHRVHHSSRPLAFFQLTSDGFINEALGLTGTHTLYGRRNVLRNADGDVLADIVEILPPAREAP